MPHTPMTEDAIKDVTEALLEELENTLGNSDYNKVVGFLHDAGRKVYERYRQPSGQSAPYLKYRLSDKNGYSWLVEVAPTKETNKQENTEIPVIAVENPG